MIYGILKDTKEGEYRVITTPREAKSIILAGHEVYAQHNCGRAAGFPDEEYRKVGAKILTSAREMYERCDMLGKVKEFTRDEFSLIREGQVLLGCIHPAANYDEVEALLESKCIAFAAEDSHRYGSPNSEAAGK